MLYARYIKHNVREPPKKKLLTKSPLARVHVIFCVIFDNSSTHETRIPPPTQYLNNDKRSHIAQTPKIAISGVTTFYMFILSAIFWGKCNGFPHMLTISRKITFSCHPDPRLECFQGNATLVLGVRKFWGNQGQLTWYQGRNVFQEPDTNATFYQVFTDDSDS